MNTTLRLYTKLVLNVTKIRLCYADTLIAGHLLDEKFTDGNWIRMLAGCAPEAFSRENYLETCNDILRLFKKDLEDDSTGI